VTNVSSSAGRIGSGGFVTATGGQAGRAVVADAGFVADAGPDVMPDAPDSGAGLGDAGQGRPGFDSLTGGNLMTSNNYRLLLSTGEGPGGNNVMQSTNYVLLGGLIGATQTQ
jgi:hypothetical protein